MAEAARSLAVNVGTLLDAVGVVVIVLGALVATAAFAIDYTRTRAVEGAYGGLRRSLGRAILLGLEFLVAADIIRTVAVSPSLESVAVLGLIVLVRTFLSFALEVELEGVLPWRRSDARNGADRTGRAPAA